MITGYKTGDVTTGPERHVAFAVNTDGVNNEGLAGYIASNHWPEVAITGPIRMGEILSKNTGEKVFHALVVHSLKRGGWSDAPHYIEACFNELKIPTDEEIATVTMGGGMAGLAFGADVTQNLNAMARSNKRVVIYDLE